MINLVIVSTRVFKNDKLFFNRTYKTYVRVENLLKFKKIKNLLSYNDELPKFET